MRFRIPGAALIAVALFAVAAAPAQADNYPVRDGTGASQTFCSRLSSAVQHPCHLLEMLFSGVPGPVSAGQNTKANSLSVTQPTDPDTRSSTATISAADVASTTVAGQGSVTLVAGTPTTNSSISWAINGASSVTIQVTGTFVATANIESSADGVNFAPSTAKILGTGLTTGTVTAPGIFRIDATGMAAIRLRAPSYTSGTLTAQANTSTASGLTQVLNPLRLSDASGNVTGVSGNPIITQGGAAASTNGSSTVTTGNTYQTVFASNTSRKGCLVQNPTTASEVLNVRVGGAAVFTLPVGAVFNCSAPSGVVISDLVEVTAATTAHAFSAISQ